MACTLSFSAPVGGQAGRLKPAAPGFVLQPGQLRQLFLGLLPVVQRPRSGARWLLLGQAVLGRAEQFLFGTHGLFLPVFRRRTRPGAR